jgi:dihydrofolate synthase/folylpolyglutamate synthase
MTNAEKRITALARFGWKLGLERMRALCAALGDPQDALRVIHVAGTNGKGSVCRYLYEVLRAHGHSAGLFTSPGIGDFRSRIEADGAWIAEDELELCTDTVMAGVGAMDPDDPPTEFEVLTAVAFVYFKSKDLDFVILETGLGGRLDSTNIVPRPLVSAITQIGLDHTDYLGGTIGEIAAEKAGIIKKGCPVVTSAEGDAARVIARRAYGLGAPLIGASEKTIPALIAAEDIGGTTFSCNIRGTRYDNIRISMPGRHQVRNAVCALAVFDVLRRGKLITSDSEALRGGMKTARLPGRFQVVSGAEPDNDCPIVIFDGAHNPEGAAALSAAVQLLLPGRRILALVAAMRDKHADGILKEIQGWTDAAVFTETSNGRSMPARELASRWQALNEAPDGAVAIADPREAYGAALKTAVAECYDALVVCGSLYLISDLTGFQEDGA